MAPSKNTPREAREARERLRLYNARQAVHANRIRRRKRDNLLGVLALVVIATLATFAQVAYFTTGPGKPAAVKPTPTPTPTPQANVGDIPKPEVAENRFWSGTMVLNDVTLAIKLDGKAAPQAVAVFEDAAKKKYFDGKTCHRLVDADSAGLLQCGSADGKGGGDDNFRFGPIENAPADGIYKAGTIAMARQKDNAFSQGHQFFIVYKDTTLPADSVGGYTVIGRVTGGIEAFKTQIASKGFVAGAAPGEGAPTVPTTITSVRLK